MAHPGFISLPDILLEQLFKMLPISDRGQLASCSSVLPAIMDMPSVWTHVTFNLDVDMDTSSSGEDLSFMKKAKIVQGLLATYWTAVQKYGRYFRNVRVVLNFAHLEKKSMDLVKELSEKHVLAHLSLHIYRPSKRYCSCGLKAFLGLSYTGFTSLEAVVGGFMDTLNSDTDVTCKLLPHLDINKTTADGVYTRLRNRLFLRLFYDLPHSDKRRSLIKKLTLPMVLPSEQDIPITGTTATAKLVSSFPNLQELSVNMGSLSDEVLLELAKAPEKRKALRHLVINLQPDAHCTFPLLSSAAWGQLTQACPALTVDCYVRAYRLPVLQDIIRPETPLVRLKVDCHIGQDQSQVELYKLCNSHSSTLQNFHLSILDRHMHTAHKGIKEMVDACPKLQHLVLDINITDNLLLELARGSRQWRTFRFNPLRVMTGPDGEDIIMGAVSGMPDKFVIIDQKRRQEIESSIRETIGFVTYV